MQLSPQVNGSGTGVGYTIYFISVYKYEGTTSQIVILHYRESLEDHPNSTGEAT